MTTIDSEKVMESLQKRVRERGDLPIIRYNGARILRASALENQSTGAADVARLVLQDAGFAAKVLRVANSAYFNRAQGQIGTISRAVVLLGLDMMRQISMGLGFVEMFQQHHPNVDMKRLVASSFAAAVLGQDLVKKAKHPRPEESFVAALLHNLGTLCIAYYLPEAYCEVQEKLLAEPGKRRDDIEKEVLGQRALEIGAELGRLWGLPDSVTESMDLSNESLTRRVRTPDEVMRSSAYLSNRIADNLFAEWATTKDFDLWLTRLELSLDIKSKDALEIIERAYSKVAVMAKTFGLASNVFLPTKLAEGAGPRSPRSALVERLSVVLSRAEDQEDKKEGAAKPQTGGDSSGSEAREESDFHFPDSDEPVTRAQLDQHQSNLQLTYLRRITQHLMSNKDINELFELVLKGIHRGIGFERVLLVLCNPERTRFQGRFGIGEGTREFAARIELPNDPKGNIFAKVFQERKPFLVENVDRLGFRNLIPEALMSAGRVRSFTISPVRAGGSVIGCFYADKATTGDFITQVDYEAFLHFTMQANLGLERVRSADG